MLANVVKSTFSVTDEKINSWNDITSHNNFYEFGVDKNDALTNSGRFITSPRKVSIPHGQHLPPLNAEAELTRERPIDRRGLWPGDLVKFADAAETSD